MNLDELRKSLNFGKDRRVSNVLELEDIEEELTSASIEELTECRILVPEKHVDSYDLSCNLGKITHCMRCVQQNLQTGDLEATGMLFENLCTILNYLKNQLSLTHESMTYIWRYEINKKENEFRFDVLTFEALLECFATIICFPQWFDMFSSTVPSRGFPTLCEQRLIDKTLENASISEYSMYEFWKAVNKLEYEWHIVRFDAAIPQYLELLMCRFAQLYKSPHAVSVFSGIEDYRRIVDKNTAYVSQRCVEDMCFSFSSMFKKLRLHSYLNQNRRKPPEFPRVWRKRLESIARDNSLGKFEISDFFREIVMRTTIRPSEEERYHRDKPNAAFVYTSDIMKHSREKEDVTLLTDKLGLPLIELSDPEKRVFEKATMDMLVALMIDAMMQDIWQIKWREDFLFYNLELQKMHDPMAVLNTPWPLVVQDFNRFNLWYKGFLYEHNSVALSFCHWLRIMYTDFDAEYEGKKLRSNELRFIVEEFLN